MATIRISPASVRAAGLAFVSGGDDLQTQAGTLRGVAMPDMPAHMAARHQAAIEAVASRLGTIALECLQIGEELQIRAAAAELADSPSETRELAAAMRVNQAVTTTAAVVGAQKTVTPATITFGRSGATAVTSTGLRLTLPELFERVEAKAQAQAQAAAPAKDAAATPEPGKASARQIEAHTPAGGSPAAAVAQAAGTAPSSVLPAAHGAADLLHGDTIDPAEVPSGEQRAEHHDGEGAPAPADMPTSPDADRQDWACWMASVAAKEGLPPELPVMMALAASGMRNVPEVEGRVGMFGLDTGGAYAPAGHGVGSDERPDADWWNDNPDAQLERVLADLDMHGGGIRSEDLEEADALARWASAANEGIEPSAYAEMHGPASDLVGECRRGDTPVAAPSGDRGALEYAQRELDRGVREFGANAGPQVDRYLASAQVGSGNPWCASFVTWALQQEGHEMPGTGWAAVATWVQAAQEGAHGLEIVDAASARPGDIVAYDWGGQGDFGADGHIGFLESKVENGSFTAVEGNAEDAVSRMDRNVGMGNVVFLRFTG